MQIDGAVALVTGANRGLGKAYARALVERGARTVYAAARDPQQVEDPDVTPIGLNITSPQQVADAARGCAELTLLINNAAELRPSPLIGAGSLEDARAQMETNYFGTLAMCQAFAPVLARNGGGALVNMCSIISFFNRPSIGSCCASKAALWSITNGIRIELRPQGTLVVSVHVGFIDTRNAVGVQGPKHDPADVASLVLDAVEAGQEEVLGDEQTRR
ncbi:MAG: SDR family oxidoreductase, partial [Actinomycetota bacterium]|nr:SDR family oxidoreductase [Actinomycetota bacterium]